jgi:hypothetical protein
LAVSNYGIGLLPFCFVPLVIVFSSLLLPTPAWNKRGEKIARPHGCWWILFVGFWSVWMAITYGIKVSSLRRVYNALGEERYDAGSMYKYSDRIVSPTMACQSRHFTYLMIFFLISTYSNTLTLILHRSTRSLSCACMWYSTSCTWWRFTLSISDVGGRSSDEAEQLPNARKRLGNVYIGQLCPFHVILFDRQRYGSSRP